MVASSGPRLTYPIRCHVVARRPSLTRQVVGDMVARSGTRIWDTWPEPHRPHHLGDNGLHDAPVAHTLGA